MEPPIDPEESTPSVERMILLGGSGFLIGLIVFLTAVGLVLRARAQPMAPVAPTQECRPSTLVLGEAIFQIEILPLGSGGLSSLPVKAGIAYWVKGTQTSPVFVLSPAPENLVVVSTIGLGSEATATWSDCTTTSYPVSAHEPGSFNTSALPDQPREGITVFFPIDASGAGFVFTAGITGEPAFASNRPTPAVEDTLSPQAANPMAPSLENTPPPSTAMTNAPSVQGPLEPAVTDSAGTGAEEGSPASEEEIVVPSEEEAPAASGGSEILAEIGLLEVTISPDGKSILLNVSVYNYGSSAFTLSESDISLTQPDGTELGISDSEPSLSKQIAAAETETFTFTFPRPSSAIATLKILTVEYDVEDY